MNKKAFTIIEIIVVVAIFLIMIVLLTPFVRMVKNRAMRINCENNLRRMSLGLHVYATGNNGAFPPSLEALYPNYVKDGKAFDCPASKINGTPDKPDYAYVAGLTESSPSTEVIVYDTDGNHGKAGKNVLRINGVVEWISRTNGLSR